MSGPPPGISGADRVNARLSANKLATLLPFIIGTYIDTVLLGFVIVALVYWVRHVRPTDRTWIKVLITLQTVFTCIQTGVLMSGWFRIFIKGFGDPMGIMDASSARFVGMIHVCQWLPTAFFFLVRAYNLIGMHWAVWIPIGVLMLASFSAGIAGTIIFRSIPPPPLLQTLTVFRTAAEVAVDIIITASIFYGYWRNQTGWDSTDKVIKRLMRWTIETQAPPTIGVLGFMITIIVQGEGPAQTYWWFLPKLYTGVLIWAVNARIKVEKELRTFAGVYPPGSRNPDKAMPALRAIGRFNSADEEEEPEVDQVQTGIVDSKMNSTSALIQG